MDSFEATRALVRRFIEQTPRARWRHHGIGALQAYVVEDAEPEVRVHIWHPLLVREGIAESGAVHDHRFDLESTVLVGAIHETVFKTYPMSSDRSVAGGSYDVARYETWRVENARSAGASKGFDGVCERDGDLWDRTQTHRTHLAGETYWLRRATFHRTWIDDLAVTLCTMREKRGVARLLVERGKEPVHAFGAPARGDVIDGVIGEAVRALDARRAP